MNLKDKIQKAVKDQKSKKDAKGKGTRGGVIVGYTKNGNPIYAKHSRIPGVKEKASTRKLSGKEKQRRESGKEKKTDAASALPEGQRKKIQNLVTKLKHNIKKCNSNNMYKKQGVPEGIDPAKHERCIQAVKDQGKKKSSAFAICNASMTKSNKLKFIKKFKKTKTY